MEGPDTSTTRAAKVNSEHRCCHGAHQHLHPLVQPAEGKRVPVEPFSSPHVTASSSTAVFHNNVC